MSQNENLKNTGLLNDIGAEVRQESAPLLEFITNHGSKIAAAVLLFFAVTAISGLWRWYTNKQERDCLDKKVHIEMTLQGKEKLQALQALIDDAPDKLKTVLCLTLGQAAIEQKDYTIAEQAYARAAREDADGNMSRVAQMSQANCLLQLGKYKDALTLLQTLEKQFDSPAPLSLRQMLAYAAEHSENTALAEKIYLDMAKDVTGGDASFLKRKAEELQARNASSTK